MKKSLIVSMFCIICFLSFINKAQAAIPTISVSSTGSGDAVQLNVNGDANAGVGLYFSGSSGFQVQALGNTNSNGSLSTNISSSQYGILSGSSIYVVVNNQQSQTTTWPTYTTSTGTLILSQTGVVIGVGQSTTITASNNGNNSLYVSNNSNPAIANTNLNGNQVTITANNHGSTVISICSAVSSSNCASVYVTVQNSNTQSLTFSQNNITVASGQTVPVTISGGTGFYTILNNSNPNIIQTSLSGSIINISTNNSSGTATITICSSDVSSCGIINVSAGTISSSGITFSQTSPILNIGQSTSVYLSGANTYNISSNTNASIVQATVSNNVLTLFGNASGSATITVCSTTGSCGTIYATVSSAGGGGLITLSQNNITLLTGQTLSVTVSGGSAPYNLPAFSNNIFQANLSGNIITLSGISTGSSLLMVCSASGGCTTLTVNVNSTATTNTNNYISTNNILTFTQNISVGQSLNMSIAGGSGSYYVASGSNNFFTANINGNNLSLMSVAAGSSSVSICSTNGCSNVYVTVTNSYASSVTTVPTTTAVTVTKFVFTLPLRLGSSNNEVSELQKRLMKEGVYSGAVTGYYGNATVSAVKKYQSIHGLETLGNVGPSTRNLLNR